MPGLRRNGAWWSVGALLFAATSLLGCSLEDSELVIGAAGAWTESNTEMTRWGLELAVEHSNARSQGRALTLRLLDDSGTGTAAVRVAAQFVADQRVVGVVGHLNSAPMLAAARVYDGNLAALSPSASSPDLSGISPWVFRTIPSDSSSGAALARFATRLGKRAAVIYENDSYGRGLADAFRRHYTGEVVSMDPISSTPGDYAPFVAYYAQVARPELVFVAGVDATGRALLREAQRQRLVAHFLGGDGWIGVVDDTSAAEGAYVGVPFDAADQRPAARTFVEAFRRRFGRAPDAYAALAYDAATVMADAANGGDGNRQRVRDHLASLGERGGHAGVTGRIRFDRMGDPEGREIVVTRVRRGALVVTESR